MRIYYINYAHVQQVWPESWWIDISENSHNEWVYVHVYLDVDVIKVLDWLLFHSLFETGTFLEFRVKLEATQGICIGFVLDISTIDRYKQDRYWNKIDFSRKHNL